MLNNLIIKSIIVACILSLPVIASSTKTLIDQEICPVMGGVINESIYSDYNDLRIYHCCGMCKSDFQKNPEKYLTKLKDLGQKAFDLAEDRANNDL
jgi:YHS domain-containing protein